MKTVKLFTINAVVGVLMLLLSCLQFAYSQELLDPKTLTKYLDAMPIPGIMPQAGTNYYEVKVFQISQQLHSQLPATILWGYGPTQSTASYPGATFVVTRGVPIDVKWMNNLVDSIGHHIIHPLAVDQTLHWADPLHHGISFEHYLGPVPITVHVHGCEVEPESDGHPESWFTPGFAIKGEGWQKQVYHYVNSQQAATLWYHDHTLGITRLNVYMGLAGFYIIRDPQHEPAGLPSGAYEIPIVIQDRSFHTDGSLAYDQEGVNPLIHPYWVPEFFGNTIVVNGKIWPYLNVEPRKYRFRFLNGSNARFYNLKIPGKRGSFVQIGTDGGYLVSPVILDELLLGPGERADVIMDFTGLAPGTEIILRNDARSPFPGGEYPDPRTVGQVMKFVVVPLTAPDLSVIPSVLNTITPLSEATVTRTLTLNEVEAESGEPTGSFLDGKMWDDSVTEKPHLGSTEIWQIVNLTGDAHPIHIHLVQTQLLNRQKFQVNRYLKLYNELNPIIPAPVTTNPPVDPYLVGSSSSPPANERGWKDTHKMFPGEVTRVIIKFTPQDQPNYLFDATAQPGYVWHCHILEHEDNEMMRPMQLLPTDTTVDIASNVFSSYTLEQNYPNPFNPTTTFRFALPGNAYVTLKLYDMIGREVAVLADGYKKAGSYTVNFDGSGLSSGVYFYKIIAGNYTDTKKMILIK